MLGRTLAGAVPGDVLRHVGTFFAFCKTCRKACMNDANFCDACNKCKECNDCDSSCALCETAWCRCEFKRCELCDEVMCQACVGGESTPALRRPAMVRATVVVHGDGEMYVKETYEYPLTTLRGFPGEGGRVLVECNGRMLGQQPLQQGVEEDAQGFIDSMEELSLYEQAGHLFVAEPGDGCWVAFGHRVGPGLYSLRQRTQLWDPSADGTIGILQFRGAALADR
jgi:hypothetical protein